ncbi:MAG: ATP-binding protein [Candidatus Competibacteraceae bacterium]
MSWVTFIWSMTAGICLTIGAVHFLVWTRRRDQWANLVFSLTAAAAAGYAVLDMVALRDRTPAEYGELWRWALFLGMLEGVLMAWFIRLYLRAGRLWLLWLICGLRALMLVLNFVPGPNFYFREITSLQPMPLLGELISRPHGVLHPWVMLMPLSFLLIIIFAIDAAHTAAKRSERRRAWVLGGLMAVGFSLGLVSYALYARGILPSTFSSQLVLSLILLMGYELSLDVLRAGQLSRELVESQQRMRQAASAADLSLWEWDIVRDEIWTTEKGRERAGIGASERIDFAHFLQSVHPDHREPTQRAVRHALEVSGELEAEYPVISLDGATRWVVARGQVERDAAGKPLRVRGVSVDVTERKKAEVELTQQRNEFAHLARVMTLSELSGSLAHELNQPLAIILTNAQAAQRLLAQQPPDLAEVRDILADIVSEDERAGEVIRRLRALLKPGQTQRLPLSVNEIIEDVLRIARSDLIGRGVTVHTALAESAPQVLGDRIQLQQVLLNLILNGSDAMAGNPPAHRHLTLETVHRDGWVRISVSDTGCGLPSEPERIFQPFYTTKKDGLGLGLPICRSIVSAHHGRLWAEPNVATRHGATFHVELPAPAERKP